MMMRRGVFLMLIGVLCAALSATNTPAHAQSGALSRLLRQTPNTAAARTMIWFGSLGALESTLSAAVSSREDVDRLPMTQRATYLSEIGRLVYYSDYSGLARAPEWLATFGINSFAIEQELTVGRAPDQVAILEGSFDVASITAALQQLGYQAQDVNGNTIFAIGNDNSSPGGSVGNLAADKLNRIALSDNRIIAAASTAALAPALSPTPNLADDPIYGALSAALDARGSLISAVLFDGAYAAANLIGNTPSAPSGLAAYQAGGIGYYRSGTTRALTIALVYADANTAAQAGSVLIARLGSYISPEQPERPLFEGWQFSTDVQQVNGIPVLMVSANMPAESDVAWVTLVQERDLGFLRPQ